MEKIILVLEPRDLLTISNSSNSQSAIYYRPYLEDFLYAITEVYDIALWSSSSLLDLKQMADMLPVANDIFLFTLSAAPYEKDTAVLAKKYNLIPGNTIIIDSSLPYDAGLTFINIGSFLVPGEQDQELLHLKKYLQDTYLLGELNRLQVAPSLLNSIGEISAKWVLRVEKDSSKEQKKETLWISLQNVMNMINQRFYRLTDEARANCTELFQKLGTSDTKIPFSSVKLKDLLAQLLHGLTSDDKLMAPDSIRLSASMWEFLQFIDSHFEEDEKVFLNREWGW